MSVCDSYSVVVLVVVAGLLLSAVQTDRRCQCDSYSAVLVARQPSAANVGNVTLRNLNISRIYCMRLC